MKNLHFRVITMLVSLYFSGTMANPPRENSILFKSECRWNGHLLTNCSFTGKHDVPADTPQAAATVDSSASFLRVLLQSPMRREDWNTKHLDLSNNLILNITLSPLAHFRALEILNLSNSSLRSISLDLPSAKSLWGKHHRSHLRNRLPCLKLLILQRNSLSDIPEGLWKLKSLQSLDLSFNRISQIGLSDFQNCLRLENLYLKSNKIVRIHPEAFKDLKKLQVVDLSDNVLTTILPMMIIALKLPHLEVDLADNPWQCDYSVAAFQNVISESWRKTWNVICSKSVGSEEAYGWTPRSRMSRETHLPDSAPEGLRAGPQEHAGTPWRGHPAGAQATRRPSRLRRGAGSPRDALPASRARDAAQDLALAVCLAVFITFLVAFCLGALARPFVDRLWFQRCGRQRPGVDRADSNQASGGAAGSPGRPGPEPTPPAWTAVELGGEHGGPGAGRDDPMSGDGVAPSALPGPPSAAQEGPAGAGQDGLPSTHVLAQGSYARLALEGSPGAHSAAAGRCTAGPGPDLDGRAAASGSKTPAWPRAARAPPDGPSPSEHPEAMHVGTYLNLGDSQQPRPRGASAPEVLSTCMGATTPGDPGAPSPAPADLLRDAGRHLRVEPGQEQVPSALDSDSDSEEGSLFTLSSLSSDDAGNAEEEAPGDHSRGARESPEEEASGMRKDRVVSLDDAEDAEDNTPHWETLDRCKTPEEPFEKPLISGPDSGTQPSGDPPTRPGSPGSPGPSGEQAPGRGISDYAAARLFEAVEWCYSLRDLEFLAVDAVPQTPPPTAQVPPDPNQSDRRGRDSGVYKYEPHMQEADPGPRGIPLRIAAGENLSPSQQNCDGGNPNSHPMDADANGGVVCPREDCDSTRVISHTQLLQPCGDELALWCERGRGDDAEKSVKSQGPLLQEFPEETSSLGTGEPLGGRDWGKDSEENLWWLEKEDSNFYIQRESWASMLGVDSLYEDQLYYDEDKDAELGNQREFK
ncbi:leucine-rich repeat-containing protein 66 [Vulpes lagopus]|uniref:leucine-rich repeat-containing protein 66 n=1 Tax=Vulpes lagopus TaxID=494514 RepID=UPI001BC8F29A|nr:leucine-rich repeat-containing protein 66 [Vulpes lagopus]XP_041581689.1 leucine-rich repeat-containing protein 66 [Vulpes lagopus]